MNQGAYIKKNTAQPNLKKNSLHAADNDLHVIISLPCNKIAIPAPAEELPAPSAHQKQNEAYTHSLFLQLD
jgi:hypothetical protein